MNASTIVAVVRQMISDGATDAAIVAVLTAMGISDMAASQPEADQPVDPNAERRAALEAELAALDNPAIDAQPTASNGNGKQPKQFRGGATPSVKYVMRGAWTPTKLADRLTGRKLEVASIILKHPSGITKREILAKMQATEPSVTNGAVMSALAPLGVLEIIKSVPLAGGTKAPSKPVTATRKPLRG